MKMNQRIKKLWVKALRSKKWRQTQKQLRNTGLGRCCLGVLCEVFKKEVGGVWRNKDYFDDDHGPCNLILPKTVMNWAGLTDLSGDTVKIDNSLQDLSEHNDDGRTFEEIATAIDKQL